VIFLRADNDMQIFKREPILLWVKISWRSLSSISINFIDLPGEGKIK
jgi:hypothetical protein